MPPVSEVFDFSVLYCVWLAQNCAYSCARFRSRPAFCSRKSLQVRGLVSQAGLRAVLCAIYQKLVSETLRSHVIKTKVRVSPTGVCRIQRLYFSQWSLRTPRLPFVSYTCMISSSTPAYCKRTVDPPATTKIIDVAVTMCRSWCRCLRTDWKQLSIPWRTWWIIASM